MSLTAQQPAEAPRKIRRSEKVDEWALLQNPGIGVAENKHPLPAGVAQFGPLLASAWRSQQGESRRAVQF